MRREVSIARQYCHEIISARNYAHIDKRYRTIPSGMRDIHLQKDVTDTQYSFVFRFPISKKLFFGFHQKRSWNIPLNKACRVYVTKVVGISAVNYAIVSKKEFPDSPHQYSSSFLLFSFLSSPFFRLHFFFSHCTLISCCLWDSLLGVQEYTGKTWELFLETSNSYVHIYR
ncbi:hypothetical protein ACS0PU_008241 [Formica fusca]